MGTTVEVFKLYVSEFPKDPNAYEKALAIDPKWASSAEAMKRQKGQ